MEVRLSNKELKATRSPAHPSSIVSTEEEPHVTASTIAIRLKTMCGIVLVALESGCAPEQHSQESQAMTLNETLAKYVGAPVGSSILPVARALANSSVLIPVQELSPESRNLKFEPTTDNDGRFSGYTSTDKSEFPSHKRRVGKDNQGRFWAYIYTDERRFLSAFPEGGPFTVMTFPDAFKIVSGDA